jgi:hypothetical protein
MVDLYLDYDLSVDMLKPHIQDHIAELADDSIVRFKCSPDLDPQVKEQVTSALLREIMPDTMNYQFSVDFRNWE